MNEPRFVGHINNFEGPVFDSSILRGARKPAKKDPTWLMLENNNVWKSVCDKVEVFFGGWKCFPKDLFTFSNGQHLLDDSELPVDCSPLQ